VNYYHLLTLFPKNKTVSKTETKEKKFVVVPIQKGIQGIKPQYFVLFCLARRKKQGRKKEGMLRPKEWPQQEPRW
jgi:hypothetical protein